MLILAILVLGLAAGWAAQLLVGNGKRSWGQLLLIGLAGSFVGGMLGGLLSGQGIRLGLSGVLGSIIGAVVVLLVMQAIGARAAKGSR